MLTNGQLADGWISLFDGQTLFGWEANSALNWTVAGGILSAEGDPPGLLCTTTLFADYELVCEFRLESGGNSGIFLRTAFEPTDPKTDCYELNICDDHPEFGTGSLVGRAKSTAGANAGNEWHQYHVVVSGPHITAALDGQPVIDYTDESSSYLRAGRIGLQMNGGRIEFRRVRLKPLGAQPLFNGQDLSGWRTVPSSKSEFTVEDGTIHVTNGAGFLETEETWSDFVLRAEVKTNVPDINSGIFFRAEPGTEEASSNGYELQVHNGFSDGDRRRPNDYKTGFGSGAIFRFQKSRWVVPDDGKWFTMTLIANGPHFSSWVNGVQVTDWTDDREPNANPRKGQRLEAGHFSLQGHDPTTDVAFRNLNIVSLPSDSSE